MSEGPSVQDGANAGPAPGPIAERVADAVFLVALHGRMLLGNPQVAALTGHTLEELRARPIFTLLDAKAARAAEVQLALARAGHRVPSTVAGRLRRSDGRSVW